VLLHLGIAVLFEIGFFTYVMIASYLAFLPSRDDVRMWLPGIRSRKLLESAQSLDPNPV
jgi:hypothetical protein